MRELFDTEQIEEIVARLPEWAVPELTAEGVLVVTPPPLEPHSGYQTALIVAVGIYLKEHGQGGKLYTELETRLAPTGRWIRPDILYLAPDSKLGRIDAKTGRLVGAPDWCCEIASAESRSLDETAKYSDYERAGVREYWQVDPEREAGQRFRCYVREAEGYRPIPGPQDSLIFPGIEIPATLL
jgi:Uma2 family endonuclease